jgi:hypothetical protein
MLNFPYRLLWNAPVRASWTKLRGAPPVLVVAASDSSDGSDKTTRFRLGVMQTPSLMRGLP